MPSVCVYCGSNPGRDPAFLEAARSFGALLARRGITLVTGGGHVGLMGAVTDAALALGGKVVGVIPQALVDRELAHAAVQDMHVVRTMHERKALMERHADAFVALPGGIGTLDELFEIWTWRQLGLHDKPVGLLDVNGYWQPLLRMIDAMVGQGFLEARHRALLVSSDDPVALLERVSRPAAPGSP